MEQECCPTFDPQPWDGKTFKWQDKRFAKTRVPSVLHIPIGFGGAMKRLMGAVESVGATCPDQLCLSEHTSMWNMDVYLAVDRDLPGFEMRTLSGDYFSKVYEGPFRDTGKWCKDFTDQAKREGKTVGRMFMWYTTCPRCARKRGKNFVAIVAQAV